MTLGYKPKKALQDKDMFENSIAVHFFIIFYFFNGFVSFYLSLMLFFIIAHRCHISEDQCTYAWLSVLAFSHQYRHNFLSKTLTTFLKCRTNRSKKKYARKEKFAGISYWTPHHQVMCKIYWHNFQHNVSDNGNVFYLLSFFQANCAVHLSKHGVSFMEMNDRTPSTGWLKFRIVW